MDSTDCYKLENSLLQIQCILQCLSNNDHFRSLSYDTVAGVLNIALQVISDTLDNIDDGKSS